MTYAPQYVYIYSIPAVTVMVRIGVKVPEKQMTKIVLCQLSLTFTAFLFLSPECEKRKASTNLL